MCIHRFALARQVKRLIMICIRTKEVDTISLFSNCALRAIFLIGRLVAIWSCQNKILIFCNECRFAYPPQTTSCLDNCATFEMCTKVPKWEISNTCLFWSDFSQAGQGKPLSQYQYYRTWLFFYNDQIELLNLRTSSLTHASKAWHQSNNHQSFCILRILTQLCNQSSQWQ